MVHEERPKCTKHQNTDFHLKTRVKKKPEIRVTFACSRTEYIIYSLFV